MRSFILFITFLFSTILSAQIYTVNISDDSDDGICDGFHCSLREAINASEKDGVPSTIKFNIPGVLPFAINPIGPFPTINHPDLKILGETQPGGPGSILIDFNYRDFMGIGFWDILASDFYISGIDFTDIQFKSETDHIFQFGDLSNNSSNSRIFNCSFIQAYFVHPEPAVKKLITVLKADNLSISNCIFGTDRTKSNIYIINGYISIDKNQGTSIVTIDSNIFVNRGVAIDGYGGVLHISKNIFGAVDTSKVANLLDPELAIRGSFLAGAEINNNFFFGYPNGTINIKSMYMPLIISNNRFFENTGPGVIHLDENTTGGIYINNNYATLQNNNFSNVPHTFIHALKYGGMYVERNEVYNYGSFLIAETPNQNSRAIHSSNVMNCLWANAVFMQGHPIPVIISANPNQITGTGIPNDSVVIYSNDRNGCPEAICEGGVELGRTLVDTSGNWILNVTSTYNASISAYQFSNVLSIRPRIYSDFSDCYQLIINNENIDEQALTIKVNPNPVTDQLKIELNESEPLSIMIYNSNGQKLSQQFTNSKFVEFDMSNYKPGIYYFQFLGKNGQLNRKVVKY